MANIRGNQMAKALVAAGLAEEPKPKRLRKGKQFKCRECGTVMVNPEWGNFMYCPNCDKKASYFIFSDKKAS